MTGFEELLDWWTHRAALLVVCLEGMEAYLIHFIHLAVSEFYLFR